MPIPLDSSIPVSFLDGSTIQSPPHSSAIDEVVALHDRFRNPLLRYLSALGLRPHDAEEVVQEVFLALFQHLLRGKSRRNLRGWVFRVAHNLGLKQRKRNHQRDFLHCAENFAGNHRDREPDPEQQVTIAQRRSRLIAVVNVLPEVDRCCLYLRAEGLRYREIAEVLGISLGGVALSLSRSLSRLSDADGC